MDGVHALMGFGGALLILGLLVLWLEGGFRPSERAKSYGVAAMVVGIVSLSTGIVASLSNPQTAEAIRTAIANLWQ